MSEEIYLIKPENISNGRFILSGEEARHCFKVKRNRIADLILLTDGQGNEYKGRITSIDPKHLSVAGEILEMTKGRRELPEAIYLAFALVKSRDLSFLIEKATELGVRGFIPLQTERSLTSFRKERWERIALRGMKTALGTILPRFYPLTPFPSLISSVEDYSLALLGYEKEEARFLSDIPFPRNDGKILVIVGPEGGFTEEEIVLARKGGVLTFSLGKRRLATGTAVLAILSIIIEYLRTKRRGGETFE
jgi:16S rRNA (uracil1498-N3)-methyltransferase